GPPPSSTAAPRTAARAAAAHRTACSRAMPAPPLLPDFDAGRGRRFPHPAQPAIDHRNQARRREALNAGSDLTDDGRRASRSETEDGRGVVRQQRPGIRATNPRWVKAAGGAARLVLLLAALTLAASCRSSSPPDVPTPAEPTGSPPAPADQPANLPQPVLAVPGDADGYGPGALYLPRAGDGPPEVTLWFGAPLAADAPAQGRVDPRAALLALTPAGGHDLDRMPEGLRLFLLPPGADIPVTLTVDAALSAEDGRRLGQPASVEIRFALPAVARLALGGSTWLPGTGEQRFTEEDTAVRLPVLRAGTAVLEAEFSRPVDQEAVVAALQRQLPAEIRTGVPSWSGDGTHLQLPLYQNVTRSLEVRLSLAPGPARGSA